MEYVFVGSAGGDVVPLFPEYIVWIVIKAEIPGHHISPIVNCPQPLPREPE